MHPCGIAPAQLALQVQHAGDAGPAAGAGRVAVLPLHLQRALGIGIGKAHVAGLHRQGIALLLPCQAGREAVHGHHGLFEHPGQVQRALGHAHVRRAPGLGHGEVQRQAAHAGAAQREAVARAGRVQCTGGHLQAAGLAFGAPAQRGLQRALPLAVDAFHQPLGGIGLQHARRHRAQRQAGSHARQHSQVQPVGAQLALGGGFRGGRLGAQRHIAARPHQALGGGELQAFGGQVGAACLLLAGQAALQRLQRQGLQAGGEGDAGIGQGDIGRAPGDLPVPDVGPHPQRAHALRHVQAHAGHIGQIGVLPQLRHIHPGQAGVDRAIPVLPLAPAGAQQWLAKAGHQAEAVAPVGGGRGVQPQVVAQALVAHHQVHAVQGQRRGGALRIGPAHRAATHHQLGLGKQPVQGLAVAVAGVRKIQPGHENLAVGTAADVQLGLFDHHLLKTQPQ